MIDRLFFYLDCRQIDPSWCFCLEHVPKDQFAKVVHDTFLEIECIAVNPEPENIFYAYRRTGDQVPAAWFFAPAPDLEPITLYQFTYPTETTL